MRHPLKDLSHHLKLLLAEFRHTAERAIAPDEGLTGSAVQFTQLEQRLMMSASPMAVVAAPEAAEATSTGLSVDGILDQVFQADPQAIADGNQSNQTPETGNPDQQSLALQADRELVIIDSTISNPDEWIAGLRQDLQTDFDVLILSADQDGFVQIADSLDGSTRYSAIHLVSHGSDGQISLGQSTLNLNSLEQYQPVLERWKAGLDSDADVLIYGCELAESEEGQQLVDSLATLWEADVAASDDLTGHQSLSADWDLEYQSGLIQATVAFSTAHTEAWVGVLPVNASPVNSIPDGQVILQDRILSFHDANSNAISISDSDVGANDLQLTLAAGAGSFTITESGTAEYVTGDGFEDSTIVLQGTVSELNAALQNLHYTASDGFQGAVDITITTNDLGNGGAETPELDTDIISVFVHDELIAGSYTVADTVTDELNRHANRGVARSLAAAPNGDLISVWRTSTNNVFFAIHDKADTLVASGQINDGGTLATDVAVASGGNGDFVVTWSQDAAADEDIFAQRYSATGTLVGSRITVDSSVGTQQAVTIDRNAAGDFAIAWENTLDGIHVKRFAADGTAIDVASLSPTGSTGGTNASIGIDRNRNLLIGWDDASGQYAQHYDGSAWGTRHTLSTLSLASGSAIGMTENGQSVIAWHEQGANWKIRYQQIATDGSLDGLAESAASGPAGDELNPSVAMDEEGNFVIAWETNGNIQARQFGADGFSIGSDINVASSGQFENNASVAVLDVKNFAVMYTSQSTNADVYVARINQAASDASDPVIDLPSRTVGTVNTPITERIMVGDDNTDANVLNFGVSSTDTGLIGLSDISVVGSGLYRDLVITPTADMIGASEITLTVTDGDGNATLATINVFVASPTITVTTTEDELDGTVTSILDLLANPGGTGISLREAITAANNTSNSGRRDRIEFNIAGGGQQTLSLNSELPVITEAVFVDGRTQPGYASSPLIGLNGNLVTGNGLTIEADDVVVRGMAIFGFQQSGVDLDTGNGILIRNADDAAIYSNYVGVDQTGLTGDGNDRDGIRIIGESHNNVIGGVGSQRRNVISGNHANGVVILGDSGTPSSTNEISFNFIGVGQDGVTDVGNSFVGVNLSNTSQTRILNNVISGNSDSGIELKGAPTTETQIQGNYIGVAADGTTILGNDGDGISLYTSVGQGPAQTQIGGIASGESNIIANNSFIGVRLDSGGGVGNSIRGNQIYNNGAGLGIDLLGVSVNDAGDPDGGTNGQQNHPAITAANLVGGDLTIQGSLNSTPNTAFDIDVYSSATADPSGAGEAETYVGTLSLLTNGSGDVAFSEVIAGAATSDGHFITVTATDSSGSTSEFAQNQIVTAAIPTNTAPSVTLTSVLASVDENADTTVGLKIADIVVTDDGLGTNILSLAGSDAAEFEIVGTELRLRSNVVLDYEQETSFSVTVQVDDAALSGSPEDSVSTTLTVNDLNDTISPEAFWFNTIADISNASGGTGATSWSNGDAMLLSDPNLTVGTGTNSGHFSTAFSLEGFTQDGATTIGGMHVVSRDITVGTSITADLKAGDVLYSTYTEEEFNGGTLTTSSTDVVLFRPVSPSDYSSGTFSILLEELGGASSGDLLTSFTLVEKTTTIGDTTVEAGDFLFVKLSGLAANNVERYEVDAVGEGATSGTSTLMLTGADLGISGVGAALSGLELVEETTSIGGETFSSGTLLLVSNNAPSDLTTKSNDIFALDVTQTDIGSGATVASSSLVMRGDDLGLTWLSSLSLGHQPVSAANNPPVADIGGPYTILEGSSLNLNASGSIDPDADGLTYTWDLDNDGAFDDAIGVSPVISWAALPAGIQDNGSYTIRVSVSDGINAADSDTTTLTITNDDPTGNADSGAGFSTTEDSTFTTANVVSNDTDPAGANDPLQVTALNTTGTTGLVSIASGNTAFDYNPNGQFDHLQAGESANDTFSYTVSDGDGGTTSSVSVMVVVNGVNDQPTAVALDNLTLMESSSGATVGQLSTTDPDSTGSHTYSVDDVRFEVVGNLLRLKPGQSMDYESEQTVTLNVTSTDQGGLQLTEAFSISITDVNDNLPVVTPSQQFSIAESSGAGTAVGTVAATDSDSGSTLSNWSITSGNDDGYFQIDGSTGAITLSVTSDLDYEVQTSFNLGVRVSDGTNISTLETVVVNVTDVNDNVPVVTPSQQFSVAESSGAGTAVGTVAATDGDSGSTLSNWTITSGNGAGHFQVAALTGEITLSPSSSLDYETQSTFNLGLTVSDGINTSTVETVVVRLLDENDNAPVVTPGQEFAVVETATAGTFLGTSVGSDADAGDTLSQWTIVSGNDEGHFILDATTGQLRITSGHALNFDAASTYLLGVTVTDGTNVSSPETVTVRVTDVDLEPSISAVSDQTILEDAAATTVSFNVFDADTLAADLIVTAASSTNGLIPTSGLTLSGTGANRQLSFTPVANESGGSTTITLTVSDGTSIASESFEVVVAAVNDAPMIAPIADQNVNEDGSVAISFSATDIDTASSVLTVFATSSDASLVAASGLRFSGSASAAVLNVTPESDQFGSVHITVTVSDGAATDSKTFLLNVAPINDAPTLSNSKVKLTVRQDSLLISKNQLLTGAADIDSSDLQLVLDAAPLHGRLVEVSPGEYVYTPEVEFSGQDRFSYSVTDGSLQSSSRVVKLRVKPIAPGSAVTNATASKAVVIATTVTSQNQQESSSESSSESDTTSATSSSQTSVTNTNATAGRGPAQTTEANDTEVRQEREPEPLPIGKTVGQIDDGFIFRKLVQIDEARSGDVGSVLLRGEISKSEQPDGRREQTSDQNLAAAKFDQSDWQYYSDLTSTVGGVQDFREHLQDDFALSDLTTGTITLASTGAAVGFVVTAVRSGMLALGFLSQLPVWTLFDPLMVVDGVTGDDGDEDSIKDIVDRQSDLNEQSQPGQNQV